MNRTQKHSGLPTADNFNAPVALPHAAGFRAGPYRAMAGKLTRFLARNVPTKKLTMRNARPLVSFTFDDAAASACTEGALLLEQHQVRGTFYISGGRCGTSSPTGRLATADQVAALRGRRAIMASLIRAARGAGRIAAEFDVHYEQYR